MADHPIRPDGSTHEPVELTTQAQARVPQVEKARADKKKAGLAAEARARTRARRSGVSAAAKAVETSLGIRRNNQTTDSNN